MPKSVFVWIAENPVGALSGTIALRTPGPGLKACLSKIQEIGHTRHEGSYPRNKTPPKKHVAEARARSHFYGFIAEMGRQV
jgi:hypothetical protein